MPARDPARSLYTRTAHVVLTRRRLAVFIGVGSLMHAAGHALLAAAGGVLARGLARGGVAATMGSGRSILEFPRAWATDPLLGLAIVGLFAAAAKLVGGVLAAWAEARVAGEVGEALRLEVLDGLLGGAAMRGPRHGDQGVAQVGQAASRLASLTTHVSEVERGVAAGVFAEVRGIVQLVPLGVLLVVLAPRLAGSAGVALLAFAALVLVTRRALKRRREHAAVETEALVGAVDEAVRHAELWATYGAEATIRAHVASLGRAIIATASRLRARAALLSGTSEVAGALALVLVLALVGAGAVGGVDRSALVPFSIAFFMAYKPLREIVDARLARGRAEDALFAATRTLPARGATATGKARPRRVDPATHPVRVKRAWPLADVVLDGLVTEHGAHAPLTLRVPPGCVAAVVGPTGVGKTALLRVLLGLDAPRAGSVRYGAECLDLCGVGPAERPFAWVAQDAPVIAASLADNVALGAGRAGDPSDALAILADIGAEALAISVGDAVLATDRAVSGGERQWIAVARALATELPVLLLDEPTSALDPAAQAKMLEAIARLRGRLTIILVTHRPEPLAIADLVVRLRAENVDARAKTLA